MALKNIVIVGTIALAFGGVALGLSRLGEARAPRSALALAPEGSSVVLHINVPALRESPLWEALVGRDAGLERIRDACGFDPLARLTSADVFVIGTAAQPLDEVGFVARGDLAREELVRCVEEVVESDGGGVHTVDIEGVPALASDHGSSRAAFLAPDGIVAGDEALVREILRIDHGTATGAGGDASFARLWARVAPRSELALVARVPDRWRGALTRLAARLDGLSELGRTVRVALGARVRSGLSATLVLELERAADAHALEDGLRRELATVRRGVLSRLSTVGGAIEHVDVEATDRDLAITVELDDAQLEAVVSLARSALDDLVADGSALDERLAPRADDSALDVPLDAPRADEVITPSGE